MWEVVSSSVHQWSNVRVGIFCISGCNRSQIRLPFQNGRQYPAASAALLWLRRVHGRGAGRRKSGPAAEARTSLHQALSLHTPNYVELHLNKFIWIWLPFAAENKTILKVTQALPV